MRSVKGFRRFNDAAGNYVEFADTLSLSSGFSFAGWVKLYSIQGNERVFEAGSGANSIALSVVSEWAEYADATKIYGTTEYTLQQSTFEECKVHCGATPRCLGVHYCGTGSGASLYDCLVAFDWSVTGTTHSWGDCVPQVARRMWPKNESLPAGSVDFTIGKPLNLAVPFTGNRITDAMKTCSSFEFEFDVFPTTSGVAGWTSVFHISETDANMDRDPALFFYSNTNKIHYKMNTPGSINLGCAETDDIDLQAGQWQSLKAELATSGQSFVYYIDGAVGCNYTNPNFAPSLREPAHTDVAFYVGNAWVPPAKVEMKYLRYRCLTPGESGVPAGLGAGRVGGYRGLFTAGVWTYLYGSVSPQGWMELYKDGAPIGGFSTGWELNTTARAPLSVGKATTSTDASATQANADMAVYDLHFFDSVIGSECADTMMNQLSGTATDAYIGSFLVTSLETSFPYGQHPTGHTHISCRQHCLEYPYFGLMGAACGCANGTLPSLSQMSPSECYPDGNLASLCVAVYGSIKDASVGSFSLDEGSGTTVYNALQTTAPIETPTLGAYLNVSSGQCVRGTCLDTGDGTGGAELFSEADADRLIGKGGGDFTVSLWVYSASTSGSSQARLISRDQSDYFSILCQQHTSSPQTVRWNVAGPTSNVDLDLVYTSTWHFVGLTAHVSNATFFVHFDSLTQGPYPIPDTMKTTDRMIAIGNNVETDLRADQPSLGFRGRLDEVHIFNRAVSDTVIRRLYLEGSLIGYWSGDAGSNQLMPNYLFDHQAIASAAVATGAVSVTASDCVHGECIDITPTTGDKIDLLTSADAGTLLGKHSFTVSLWLMSKTSSGDSDARVLSRDQSAFWALIVNQNGSPQDLRFVVAGASSSITGRVIVNQWHHFAASHDDEKQVTTVYVDGKQHLTFASGHQSGVSSQGVVLGSTSDGSHNFIGRVDEVRLHTMALRDDVVAILFHQQSQYKTYVPSSSPSVSPQTTHPTTSSPTSRGPTSLSPTTTSPASAAPTQTPTTASPATFEPTQTPTTDAPTTCTASTYPALGTCLECPNGFYCPDGYQKIACPYGSDTGYKTASVDWTPCRCAPGFKGVVHNATHSNCTACAEGMHCTGGTHEEICPAGYYCDPPGNKTLCTPGMYCPAGTGPARNCSLGSFCKTTIHMEKCIDPINIGYYCPEGSSSRLPCTQNYYCPNASVRIACTGNQSCPAGTFTLSACPVGKWCNGSIEHTCDNLGDFCQKGTTTPTNCSAGHYCTTNTQKVECRAGKYCPERSTAQTDCPAGSFCPDPSVKFPCPNATYCPAGSTAIQPCPPGFYCVVPSLKAVCSSGFYCPENSTVLQKCPAGSFCSSSSTIASCVLPAYCPEGSTTNETCAAGSYCPNTTSQYTCDAGQLCLEGSTEPVACPAGSYCPAPSTKLNCSHQLTGKYCPTGSTTLADCPAGSYCPNASVSVPCSVIEGHLCLAGQTRPSTCPLGSYCQDPSYSVECPVGKFCVAGSSAPIDCPVSHYCPNASYKFPCDTVGAYCEAGSVSEGVCPEGSYCPDASTVVVCTSIAGFAQFCRAGVTNYSICAAGRYCPSPVSNLSCGAGTYCGMGSVAETTCPKGYYCPTPKEKVPCDEGEICVAGSSRPSHCAEGAYCPVLEGEWATIEITCPPGAFCPANSTSQGSCPVGYFCADAKTAVECPNGTYCPAGSSTAQACTAGSYCPNASVILECVAGTLSSAGQTNCSTCPVNKYCTGTLTGRTSGESCPTNSLSPTGSVSVLDCECDTEKGYEGTISRTDSVCTEIPNAVDFTFLGAMAGALAIFVGSVYACVRSKKGKQCIQLLLFPRVQVIVGTVSELADLMTDGLLFLLVIQPTSSLSMFHVPMTVILSASLIVFTWSFVLHFKELFCRKRLVVTGADNAVMLYRVAYEHAKTHYPANILAQPRFHDKDSNEWSHVSGALLSDEWMDKPRESRNLRDSQCKNVGRLLHDVRLLERKREQLYANMALMAVESLPMMIIGLSFFSIADCGQIRALIFRLSLIITGVMLGAKGFKALTFMDVQTLLKKYKDQVYHLCLDVHDMRSRTHTAKEEVLAMKREDLKESGEHDAVYGRLLSTAMSEIDFYEAIEEVWTLNYRPDDNILGSRTISRLNSMVSAGSYSTRKPRNSAHTNASRQSARRGPPGRTGAQPIMSAAHSRAGSTSRSSSGRLGASGRTASRTFTISRKQTDGVSVTAQTIAASRSLAVSRGAAESRAALRGYSSSSTGSLSDDGTTTTTESTSSSRESHGAAPRSRGGSQGHRRTAKTTTRYAPLPQRPRLVTAVVTSPTGTSAVAQRAHSSQSIASVSVRPIGAVSPVRPRPGLLSRLPSGVQTPRRPTPVRPSTERPVSVTQAARAHGFSARSVFRRGLHPQTELAMREHLDNL